MFPVANQKALPCADSGKQGGTIPLGNLKTLWRDAPPNLRGILLVVIATVGFSVMHVLVRYLSSELHPIQISFFRNAFGLLVFAPWLLKFGVGVMSTRRLGLHGVRAVLNVSAMFAYFTALSIAPLAQVTALGFTAPIFAALLSVLLLGERFRFRRWAALAIGFVGTLVILRPGIQPIDLGSMLVLISAVLWGVTMIVIKMLARTESSMAITGYMNLFLTILSIGPALYFWQMPRPETWIWLLLIGVTGTLAQVAFAQALKEADAGVVMPFDFLKLVWISIMGFILFAEVPDIFIWLGGAIVFSSTSYLAYRESRLRGDDRKPPPRLPDAP